MLSSTTEILSKIIKRGKSPHLKHPEHQQVPDLFYIRLILIASVETPSMNIKHFLPDIKNTKKFRYNRIVFKFLAYENNVHSVEILQRCSSVSVCKGSEDLGRTRSVGAEQRAAECVGLAGSVFCLYRHEAGIFPSLILPVYKTATL